MRRQVGLGVLIVTAVLALVLGTVAGAVSGGITAYLVDSDDADSQPVAATTATRTSVETPTPAPTAVAPQATSQPASNAEVPTSIADIVEQVSPAVVTVVNKQAASGFFGGDQTEPTGTGTGFIIDDSGHVVTNNHVVEGSQELQVLFADGTEASATLVGSDQFADLAVIKVDGSVPATIAFGDSSQLRPGDRVIAIGSALGDFTNTVTEGIVSALNRNLQTPEGFNMENMIQHDAPINPGNSGGPLLNLSGEVVGVNTAVVRQAGMGVAAEGLGFAIPSSTVQDMVNELTISGRVGGQSMGIVYEPLTPRVAGATNLPVENGVVVQSVEPGSPAADAGIQADDIITKVNEQQIDADHPLVNELFNYKVGDTITLEIYRASTSGTLSVQVTLAARPDNS